MTDGFRKTPLPAEVPPSLSRALFEGILHISADAIICVDDSFRIVLFNQGAETQFGYSTLEALGQPLDILIPARFRTRHQGNIREFREASTPARRMGERQRIFALHKSGREFPAEASISKLLLDGRWYFTVVLRDVTSRIENEDALRESEQRLWAFLDNSSVIGWMKDSDGRYIFVNARFQYFFRGGSSDCVGKTDFDLWPRAFAEDLRNDDKRVMDQNREIERVHVFPTPGGPTSWLTHMFPFTSAKGGHFVGGLGVDITPRVEAEDLLAKGKAELESRVEERTRELREEMRRHQESQAAVARLQRMEALGQLTGGIAHDFNNLLTVISGNLQLIDMEIGNRPERKYLEEAERAAEMGARLNQRLMTFAKQRRLAPTAINLNDQVISVREMLRRSLGGTVTLATDLADGLWMVQVDPSEIENALVNLAINARDAMPNGGQLSVETKNVSVAEADMAQGNELPPGDYVQLSVADTGLGMDSHVQQHAFEPFFTTKEPGKGTGLGLATIYGFVKQSGGHVVLETAPGKGTTVSILLPKLEVDVSAAASSDGRMPVGRPSGETVLVVEDDVNVRRVTVERIRVMGYRVLEAENGSVALDILNNGQAVDIVFSDIVMPGGLSGYALARAIQKTWPRLPILLTSGFTPGLSTSESDAPLDVEILLKPYSQSALEDALWRTLKAANSLTPG